MTDLKLLGLAISPWIYAPLIYVLWVLIWMLVKRIVFAKIRSLVRKTPSRLDDVLVDSLNLPLTILIASSGFLVLGQVASFRTGSKIAADLLLTFQIMVIAALVIFLDKFFKELIHHYKKKAAFLSSSGHILQSVVRITLIVVGVLILLDSLGISITPLVASLGITSLAVALALQPTLENFFSGVQLVIDRPIRVGDFIRLDSGEEGTVEKIGWRSTWIRLPANNMVIVPNKVLVNSKVLNYYYPTKEIMVSFPIGIHYQSDLDQVEKITEEVALETLRSVAGGMPEFPVSVRYVRFGELGIEASVTLKARELSDTALIKHELIKRLHARYAKEGIVIPTAGPWMNLNCDSRTESR